MTISSLTLYSIPSNMEETTVSKWARPIAIAIGLITLFSGVFIGWGIPRAFAFGCALSGSGLFIIATGLILKCQTPKDQTPHRTDRANGEVKPIPVKLPTFLETVAPLPETPVVLTEPPATPCKPSTDGVSFLTLDAIGVDMCLHIASFLTIRERVTMMGVSKEWCEIARANLFWRPFLGHEAYRIWGAEADSSALVRHEHGYAYQENDPADWSAFHQFRVYHDLQKRGLAGTNEGFFDYLARLMPGGPLAFDSIPYVQVENTSEVTAESMVKSVIRGSDRDGNIFIALRLADQALEEQTPVVLLFINKNGKWIQQANAYWQEGILDVRHQTDENYVLALLGGTQLANRECFNAPKYKKTLQLV